MGREIGEGGIEGGDHGNVAVVEVVVGGGSREGNLVRAGCIIISSSVVAVVILVVSRQMIFSCSSCFKGSNNPIDLCKVITRPLCLNDVSIALVLLPSIV